MTLIMDWSYCASETLWCAVGNVLFQWISKRWSGPTRDIGVVCEHNGSSRRHQHLVSDEMMLRLNFHGQHPCFSWESGWMGKSHSAAHRRAKNAAVNGRRDRGQA